MADEKEKTVRVKVGVPPREGFKGYWSAQTFFAEGVHEYEIPAKKLAEVKAEPLLMVVELDAPTEAPKAEDEPPYKAPPATDVVEEAAPAPAQEKSHKKHR